MGSRGPLPKPDGRRVGHRRRRVERAGAPEAPARIPKAPADLSPQVRAQWRAFWRSPAAGLVARTDRPALERIFVLRDIQAKAFEHSARAMLVKGSAGQLRVNPLLELAVKLEGSIGRLEGEFGLTPFGRMRMGLEASGTPPPTLEDLNRRIAERRDGDVGEDSRRALLGEQETTPEGQKGAA